jgi:SAM-dependent methyltransferase
MQRHQEARHSTVFLCGDAQTYSFEPGSFDAVFSRFGVMFFDDPVAAFRNLRGALRPGGRLGFVCWQSLSENELDELPLRAASPHLPPDLVAAIASSACFSFSDPGETRTVLRRAGFTAIEIAPRDELVGSGCLQGMVDVCSKVGALGAILREHPHLRQDAIPAMERALADRDSPTGPMLRAATWVVTARSDC